MKVLVVTLEIKWRGILHAIWRDGIATRLGKLFVKASLKTPHSDSGGHQNLQDLVASLALSKQALGKLQHSAERFAGDRVDFLADCRLFFGELESLRFSA